MRLVNFQRGREVRVGVQDGKDAVDVIDALGGLRRVPAANRAILGDTISFLLIRDTPPVGMYVLNMFCMRGSRLWGSRLHRACVV